MPSTIPSERQSSIINHPLHHPSSIVHRPSSMVRMDFAAILEIVSNLATVTPASAFAEVGTPIILSEESAPILSLTKENVLVLKQYFFTSILNFSTLPLSLFFLWNESIVVNLPESFDKLDLSPVNVIYN